LGFEDIFQLALGQHKSALEPGRDVGEILYDRGEASSNLDAVDALRFRQDRGCNAHRHKLLHRQSMDAERLAVRVLGQGLVDDSDAQAVPETFNRRG